MQPDPDFCHGRGGGIAFSSRWMFWVGTRDKFHNIGDWGPQGVEWDLIDIGKCNQIA